MNKRALTATLIVLALAACTSTPTPTGTLATTPTGTPAPTALPTATTQPTLPPTPTPTLEPTLPPTEPPTATPTVEPTATPTVAPSATPSSGWTEPQLIAGGVFQETDVVVDSSGFVHVAAAGYGTNNRGIWYFTNASGAWTEQHVSSPPHEQEGDEYDGEPSLALDGDGSVWIAFTRWSCWECAPNPPDGVFVTTNASGTWSEPQEIADCMCGGPSLNVRDGIARLTYHEYGGWYFGTRDWPVWYATTETGQWATTRVARKGSTPQLSVDADGLVQILFAAPNDLQFVTQLPDGSFGQAESLPGSGGGFDIDLTVEPSSRLMWAGWSQFTDDSNHINVMVASRGADGWSQPELAIVDGDLTSLAAGQGSVHASAVLSDPDHWGGLVYASNLSGPFATEKLAEAGGDTSALVVDAVGRAYVVYSVDEPKAERGLWLLVHARP